MLLNQLRSQIIAERFLETNPTTKVKFLSNRQGRIKKKIREEEKTKQKLKND
jgi:hypothetical protein